MTTFVLGAGASRHVGYPFAKSMGRGLFNWMTRKVFLGCYNTRAAAASLQEEFNEPEDLEQLLTRVDEIIFRDTAADAGRRGRLMNHDKPALVASIREWFSEIRQQSADTYRIFSERVLQAGDCVISFNYDNSLERELKLVGLWALGDGYAFPIEGFEYGSKVTLLKLHGSANWVDDIAFPSRPLISDSDLSFLGYEGKRDGLFASKGEVPALFPMILPTACKRFYVDTSLGRMRQEFWDHLWDAAGRCIEESTRLVIVGYSLPLVDERACDLLLKRKHLAHVEVCCGSDAEEIVNRFRESGHRDAVEANATLFDSFVRDTAGAT